SHTFLYSLRQYSHASPPLAPSHVPPLPTPVVTRSSTPCKGTDADYVSLNKSRVMPLRLFQQLNQQVLILRSN
ncbi:hypothetical protein L9F63_025576, partial [Diploptera punctata]